MTVESPPGTETAALPAGFDTQVARTPDAVAVRHEDTGLTYRALDARANRLARLLMAAGAGRGTVVAVVLPRSPDLVAALLAVLKAGAAYAPIDTLDPTDRMNYIVGDSAAALVLTVAALANRLDGVGGTQVLALDELDLEEYPADPVTDLDRGAAIAELDAAYVIYTSGSTGRPKGVVVEHRAMAAYLRYARDNYPGTGAVSLLHSSVSFDMAVTTLYAPLLAGGTVALTDLKDVLPSAARPGFLKVTPSHLGLLHTLPASCAPTGQLVVGGELLTGAATDAWRARYPGVTVINEYGPTEATVGCSVRVIRPEDRIDPGPVPIGTAMPGTRMFVLDAAQRPVAGDGVGELYIAGAQLARGYLGRPGLTASRFVPDPSGEPGGRMYRTGDLARRRADGLFEYCGRTDDQVKIRGFRIELGEVEAAVSQDEAVLSAAVIARGTGAGIKQLVAYVVPVAAVAPDMADLRARLARTLPEYLIPTAFVLMSALPLTTNGKLDVRALPAPDPEAVGYAPPRTPAESSLCGLFAELTGAPRVGIDDDFVALGGDSVIAARLVSLARRKGFDLVLREVLRRRTVRRLLADGGS